MWFQFVWVFFSFCQFLSVLSVSRKRSVGGHLSERNGFAWFCQFFQFLLLPSSRDLLKLWDSRSESENKQVSRQDGNRKKNKQKTHLVRYTHTSSRSHILQHVQNPAKRRGSHRLRSNLFKIKLSMRGNLENASRRLILTYVEFLLKLDF